MSGHTPGPWRVEPSHDINGELFAIGTNYQWPEGSDAFVGIAFTAHKDIGPYAQHREADARLIAAAPELLEALKAIMANEEIDGVGGGRITLSFDYRSPLAEQCRASIAKAEGRS